MALEGQWDRIFNIWVVPENWVAWLLKGCILILREQKRIEKSEQFSVLAWSIWGESSLFFGVFMLFIQHGKQIKIPIEAWPECCARSWVPLHWSLSWPRPGSRLPWDLLSLITFPQTPLRTQMLSWPKPHPGSTPDLDSPAVPCRLSSTSPRWTSACAARSLPKPELALPSPHCQALAQP